MKTYLFIRHFSATKIQLLFKPAILSSNYFPISIFFLINQIAKQGRKTCFPIQNAPKHRKNDKFKRTFYLVKIQEFGKNLLNRK